jgi:hypothetical protein
MKKLSDIMAADAAGAPIRVQTYDDAGTANYTDMRVGRRYRIATELINVLCTVVALNHGAERAMKLQYITEGGDHLLAWFSPNEILRVYPLY